MCQARVSNKSGLQECFRVLGESVLPECATRVWSKTVRQECLTRAPHKSVPQECPTRVCHKSVTKGCPTRLSEKSVKQEYSARVAFNAIEHLLFAFHCSVGTLLLRELKTNAFGFVASISFFWNWNLSFSIFSLIKWRENYTTSCRLTCHASLLLSYEIALSCSVPKPCRRKEWKWHEYDNHTDDDDDDDYHYYYYDKVVITR